MSCPEAVRKHDGRIVAYDSHKLATSITRAACATTPSLTAESAEQLGDKIASLVGAMLVSEGRSVPASADIRTITAQILSETNHATVSEAYVEYARRVATLLWRIRVIEPGTPLDSSAGSPWDRRRLLESLRASGIARDPAGDMAHEVERRVVALNQERISPALIHALTMLVISSRALNARNYATRRLAFSLTAQTPRFDVVMAERTPLPSQGPALTAFWLQAVHSHEVVRAAQDNLLSLAPYPSHPDDATDLPVHNSALDLLALDANAAARETCVCWRGDGAERLAALAQHLAQLPAAVARGTAAHGLNIFFQSSPVAKSARHAQYALPVTINLAGILVREALKDQLRANVRTTQIAAVAAQAHREREEYFNLSPVRGRILPVAVAGLWNAAAWLQSENFDAPQPTRESRMLACAFVSVLRSALDTLRHDTGMELRLVGNAPPEAMIELWRRDCEFFMRDGVTLNSSGGYDGAIKLAQRVDDLGEQFNFARAAGLAFDDPLTLTATVPLGAEFDANVWRELLRLLAQAGLPCVRLLPGGTFRDLRSLTRMIRANLETASLFDQVTDNQF
ncbi:MAG: ATP cone domain-containing protein [Planctomycetota bacterium]